MGQDVTVHIAEPNDLIIVALGFDIPDAQQMSVQGLAQAILDCVIGDIVPYKPQTPVSRTAAQTEKLLQPDISISGGDDTKKTA